MNFWNRLKGRYQRTVAAAFYRRPFHCSGNQPIISFTFDDFPSSAGKQAASMLEHYGLHGTYYASLGLMGEVAPTGEIFRREDLTSLLQRGHEVGCHTFHHLHAFDTRASAFEKSIHKNRQALRKITADANMETHSYPISVPRPSTKNRCSRHFRACRAGGQTFNRGKTDLNCLRAFFLEQSRDDLDAVKSMIDANKNAKGWLIFATHDVCNQPTRYGCVPGFFQAVVDYSVTSGALILPVAKALNELGVPRSI